MMTRKDLARLYTYYKHFVKGYCCEYNAPGGKASLVKLGYNAGVYGWNWSLYADNETDTLYCSYYRNVPDYLSEK